MKYLFLLTIALCFSALSSPAQWTDPSPHDVRFIKVDSLVRLEVLDWGGKGEPLVFLTGLGNSAHVYDDFAPRFTDRFHVLAITRRGYGASGQPPSGYSIAALTEDVRRVLDTLRFKQVFLAGHSIAGEELTLFAATYPERVRKIVYLDAAYDRTYIGELFQAAPVPPPPSMTKADSASAAALVAYGKRVYSISYPEAEARAVLKFDDEGRLAGTVTPDSINAIIFKNVVIPDFKKITVPALAIYAVPDTPQNLIRYYNTLDSTERKKGDTHFKVVSGDVQKQMEKFKQEATTGKVVELHGAHHYVFLSRPAEVEQAIRQFLLSITE